MGKNALYSAGAYLRLSRDDEDAGSSKIMSNSIVSQRDMICAFVRDQEDMELFDLYIDDGYSGANFERPDFKRMIADIRAGLVNCVIVKDLSRFGRDYIEAGRFIQKTFPAFSVRFIAITDNYDSLTADRNMTSLVIPVKNFVNDSYCRDISGKVKSHQKIKREQGRFIGAFAVYGYCKDLEDKNRLVPDRYASGIVKNIFRWKLEGMSNLAIANQLNSLGALSPLEYKKLHGENYTTGFQTGIVSEWSAPAVKRILTNEIYTGTMVQGKREKTNYKVEKLMYKPKEEWIRVANTHEPIISKEDYQRVQKLLQISTRAGNGKNRAHLFAGLLFCGDCGRAMNRRINRYKNTERIYYICSTRNRSEGCSRHSIAESDLMNTVFHIVKTQTAIFLDVKEQRRYIQGMGTDFEEIAALHKELEWLREEQRKYPELRAGLYEDLKMDVITQEDFESFNEIYEKQHEKLQTALAQQEGMMRRMICSKIHSGRKMERLKKVMQPTAPDRNVLLTFIDRIEVYEDKKICLKLRCREEFRRILLPKDCMSAGAAK